MIAFTTRVAALGGRQRRVNGAAPRRRHTGLACLGAVMVMAVMAVSRASEWSPAFHAPSSSPKLTLQPSRNSQTGRRASNVYDKIDNPVKTVSETLADFYKAYNQPPLLPMYRPFLIDFLTQAHLALYDSRFNYDAVFALGMKEYFTGLMGTYDKLVSSGESDKIWAAMLGALGLDAAKVTADADAITEYAKSTSPADILKQMESGEGDSAAAKAFASIRKSLYSGSFSIGLFKIMELAGVEVNKANVEEWAKALTLSSGKISTDLETYRQNKNKLKAAEEMIREVEIREKKKLAERLEQKAKALAAKAKEAEPKEEKSEEKSDA